MAPERKVLYVDRYNQKVFLEGIKAVRARSKLSQAKLSVLLKTSTQMVSNWEQGRARMNDVNFGQYLLQCGSSRREFEKEINFNG